jgi:hypothetical protein
MRPLKTLVKSALLPIFGASLLLSGCGGGGDSAVPTEEGGGEKKKNARIEAYGKTGNTPGANTGPAAASSSGAQGEARSKGR